MKFTIALTLVFALAPVATFAGTPSAGPPVIESGKTTSPWWLTITPYSWITATEGDMGVLGNAGPVDISFKDTIDDLEFAYMMAVEGGFDRWAFGIDGIFAASASSASLPADVAPPYTRATVDFDQFFGRLHGGYQVVAEEGAKLTAFVGARYSYISTELVLSGGGSNFRGDDSKSWIDPIIGLHGYRNLNDRWFIHSGGDIGGFDVSSDLIWQANIALGYRMNDRITSVTGYRALGVDYSSGGFLVDTVAHGPFIGLAINF